VREIATNASDILPSARLHIGGPGWCCLSHATVKRHINRIFAKTGARDRAQAVRYAYQHHLAAPTP